MKRKHFDATVYECLAACVSDFRSSWRALVLTDIAFKAIAFVVLTPSLGLLLRLFLAISGRRVLSDQDILAFLIGPVGWIAAIVVGAAWIAIVALEQAALMRIVVEAWAGRIVPARSALSFAARHAWPVLGVTGRMVAFCLLAAAPLLAAVGAVYAALLTRYDINFYLAEKPPEFWIAAGLAAAALAAMVFVLARMLIGWFFALPLLIFEHVSPGEALQASRRRTGGHCRTILIWVAAWLAGVLALSAAATGAVGLLGRTVLPIASGSLTLFIVTVGALLLLMGAVNLLVTLATATTFSVLLVNLYRKVGGPPDAPQTFSETPTAAAAGLAVSRRAFVAGSVAVVLLAAVVGAAAVRSVRLEDHTEIMAHRGASAAAPENTLAAIERAIADGADWVEVDVQESRDGVVLVVHDSDLKKIAKTNLKIWEATAEELRSVDVGSTFSAQFAGERIPTLDEVLQACKGRVRVNIELKYYGHDQKLEQRVAELVERHAIESDIVVMSLKRKGIEKMRSLRPGWKVGLLSAVAVGDLTGLDADFLAVNVGLATPAFIRSAHRAKKQVYVWTVNDPVTMSAMIGRGADSIITDNPALARLVLEQRAGLSPMERLLVELARVFGVEPETTATADDT